MSSYTTVARLREEGVPVEKYSDSFLEAKIVKASALIEMITERWFYPRDMVIKVDGQGSRMLNLDTPIISINSIKVENLSAAGSNPFTFDISNYRVYNRHVTQGLTNPDDRSAPRIEFVSGYYFNTLNSSRRSFEENTQRFTEGAQNIVIDGTFGYTDYSPTNPEGVTPILIEEACVILVIEDLGKRFGVEAGDRFDIANAGRVRRIRTKEQELEYFSAIDGAGNNAFAGNVHTNPEVDKILRRYMRPSYFGSA